MNKILVISDDELLSQLYVTNIEVYLDAEVTLVHNVEDAVNSINENPDFGLIISLTSMGQENVVESLKQLFLEKEVIIPIIAIGESVEKDPNIIEVKSYYSIQNIIRSAAKILGVTAQKMATKVTPKYYPVELKFIEQIKKAPVNLYMEVLKNDQAEHVLLANKDTEIEKAISKLAKEGVERIFVNSQDRLQIVNNISLHICESLTLKKLVGESEKSERMAMSMDFVAKNLVSEEISNEIITLVNACSKVMAEVIDESPSLSSLLKIFLKNKNNFGYTHSMLSAYVASHIVKNVPWGGASHVEKINFVLFFHDLPLAPIFERNPQIKNEEDLLFQGNLTDQEKEIVLNHARISAELVYGLKKCPMGADLLIKQHHGMGNGIGFALEYRDDISPLSKIIIVSEAFVEHILNAKDEGVANISVQTIVNHLKERFSKHTYKKIIDTLLTIKI